MVQEKRHPLPVPTSASLVFSFRACFFGYIFDTCRIKSRSLLILLATIFLLAPLESTAFSLGEIRTISHLGEPLHVEIKLIAQVGERLEASCFKLQKPLGNDEVPWLQKANFNIRKEQSPILVVTSGSRIKEPVLRIGLMAGCGQSIQRDYNIMLAPPPVKDDKLSFEQSASPLTEASSYSLTRTELLYHSEKASKKSRKLSHRTSQKMAGTAQKPDRLVLSGGNEQAEPSLRLAPFLSSWQDEAGSERQRTLLRMEYRLLQSIYEQTMVQLDTTEKLRKMETSIDQLEQQSQSASQPTESAKETIAVTTSTTVESTSTPTVPEAVVETKPPAPEQPSATITPPVPATSTPSAAEQPVIPEPTKAKNSWWKTFIFLFLVSLAIGGWIFSKHYQNKQNRNRRFSNVAPEPVIDPRRFDEFDEFDEPRVNKAPLIETSQESVQASTLSPVTASSELLLSQISVNGSSIEEHFEANPVMELAEIMLSFGRVKGAAQALQEFVDSNPEEALQPWIRLMDVYRMAGMRSEFERVAAELNQHFNVEIQLWDEMPAESRKSGEMNAIEPTETLPIEWPKSNRKASSIEEAEHIADRIVALWPQKECSEFLDQLLRSNRGGLRSGFARPVVEEIIFLIELQASIEEMANEATGKT